MLFYYDLRSLGKHDSSKRTGIENSIAGIHLASSIKNVFHGLVSWRKEEHQRDENSTR